MLSCPEMNGNRLRELGWALEQTGTELCVASALLDVAGPRTTIRPIAGLPLLHVDQAELGGSKRLIKGALDRFLASLALLMLSPAFIGDRGGHPRATTAGRCSSARRGWARTATRSGCGSSGRWWWTPKRRRAQLDKLNEATGVLFKMRRDPRITKVGGWLRRWSLDELPQLINVVIGDMSLVGPRPALPHETARYGDDMQRRLKVLPGITGLWQVSGRSDLPWEEAVRLDIRYVENWSVALDLQILWKTLAAVLRGSGAY